VLANDSRLARQATWHVVPLRAFADNYIWTIRDDKCAAVVDPGDARPVLDYLGREQLELVAILNTHHHADHVGGNAGLLARWKTPVYGPHDERIAEVTHRLQDGSRFALPHFGVEFEVMEIPGHTRSHIAFHGGGLVFSGDTLFAAGCGRLFEGTPRQMHDSLSRLMQLPDATRVYCGHEYTLANIRFAKAADPGNEALRELEATAQEQRNRDLPTLPSTIAQEKATNPFVRVREPAVVAAANRFAGKTLNDPVGVLAAIREWKNGF
jgi:hydroxyacylglutathione hydrolase